jgi:hypothetical protein
MNASAAVRQIIGGTLEKSSFHCAEFSLAISRANQTGRAGQIKQALRQAGLTVTQVSAMTRKLYGMKSPYFIPPTFLYKQKKGITPHICQIVALSEITRYRFADWMDLCGFNLRLILPLQLTIHTERTAILTPHHSVPTCDCTFPWNSMHAKPNERFLFAKIGSRDAVVHPRLLPGSIVRADRCYSPRILDNANDYLWLVEHAGGLTCCHVKRIDKEHVVLQPNRPPLSAWPLRLSTEARILGLVDLELRPREAGPFEPMCGGATKSGIIPIAPHTSGRIGISRLLRWSRSRTGLTLRAAHGMTVRIAQLLRNKDYSIALGLLSDYEAMNKLPRHVTKLMSLCVIYGIDLWDLTEAGGIHIDDSDKSTLFRYETRRQVRREHMSPVPRCDEPRFAALDGGHPKPRQKALYQWNGGEGAWVD